MPLEPTPVGLAGLGKMPFEQALGAIDIPGVPSFLGHVDVVGIEGSLKLLLFGGELVGEGFDFVTLFLGLVALLGGLFGFLVGFLSIGFCLSLGHGGSDGLP